ncbi:PAS domain-containing sensor histidine kinase (plasmid) [Agrobacterium sp. rho-8.1]|nr:PAS domain-containing protein [Agrobacterium sp. rho-8.1]
MKRKPGSAMNPEFPHPSQNAPTIRERFLEAVLQSAIDYAIIALDLDGLVTSWNEGARLIMGWTEEEMMGAPAAVFFTDDDKREGIPQREMTSALEKGRGNDERWHLRKDGTHFWASGEMMTLRDDDGRVQGFIKIIRDRTEQRERDEKIRADAEFMRKVLSSSDDCIKVLDLDARLTFMSEGGKRVMEVDDFDAIAECPWPDFWQDSGNDAAKKAVEAAKAGQSERFIGMANTARGNPRWWDVQVTPILGADGKPERILSISRDITATKVAEETSRETQARLRSTLKAGGLGYWQLNMETMVLEASDICKLNFGRSPDQPFTYSDLREAVHPDDRTRMAAAVQDTISTGSDYDIQYRIIKPDGDTAWVLIRAQLIRGDKDNPTYIAGVSLDITDLKTTEERLARSEERLNLALGASSIVGIWDWDLKTNLIYADPNFAEIYTVDPIRAAQGAPLEEYVKNFHPDDLPTFEAELARLFEGQETFNSEYRILQPDGGVRWVHARGRLIRDEATKPIRFSGASVEITERKMFEETQSLLMHELGHRVKNTMAVVQAVVTQSLRNVTSVEEAAGKVKSRLAAMAVAHDILINRNWLSATLTDVIQGTASATGLGDDNRLRLSGPAVKLGPQQALSIGLVIHELLTNALKYGALSNETGSVKIAWEVTGLPTTHSLKFVWQEINGPSVIAPARRGFGSRLIASSLQGFGDLDIQYLPGGILLELVAALSKLEPLSDEPMSR